jgi:hypothetical protein
MLNAELDGQKGFAIFHNGQTEFYPTKHEAEKRERAIAEERIRESLRKHIAKNIRAYVKAGRATFKGDSDDYARGARAELRMVEKIADAIENDMIGDIPHVAL